MIKASIIFVVSVCMQLYFASLSYAQVVDIRDSSVREEPASAFTINVDLKNSHLWRGFIVTNTPNISGSAQFTSKNRKLDVGLWSAAAFDGVYREFVVFANYRIGNFSINVFDSYNNTGAEQADYFNYDPASTIHFIDVNLSYHFSKSFPLTVSFATIVAGRDTYISNTQQVRNRYSHYAQLEYKVFDKGNTNVVLYLGGTFSTLTRSTFYSSKPSIVNTGLLLNQNIRIAKHDIPVFAQGMWNPEARAATLGLGIRLF